LKIEGRGRSAEYVYTVTKSYREAVHAIQQGTYTKDKTEAWKKNLSTVYNRGFWNGYYLGRKMGEWANAHGSVATEKKMFIGQCIKYFPKAKVGEFEMQTYSLKVGHKILITGPATGVV
jgi:putative protease